MTRVLSMERVATPPPEWVYFLGAAMLAAGVVGTMWSLIKMFK